jgi:membrane protein
MSDSVGPSPTVTAVEKPGHGRHSWLARIVKLLRFAAARTDEQRLIQVASSLTFTTVLAIVPLLAVVLSLFTAFPVFQQFRLALEDFLANSLMPPDVSSNIMDYLNQFALQASRLTTIGGAFVVVTAILLVMTIDRALNDIWHVGKQRPLSQRVLIYWCVVTLGPVVVGASLWATSFVTRESMGLVAQVPAALGAAISALPLVSTGLGFSALFALVPNRTVYWRDALAGGVSAAVILEVMKIGFTYYVTRFPTYTVIYGAFATLPIFLLWIYLSWLAVLFGATIAASLPIIRLRRWEPERYPGAPFIDALGVLHTLYDAQGTTPPDRSSESLSETLHLDHEELTAVLETMAGLGLVVRTDDTRWILACDPGRTRLDGLLDTFLLDRDQPRIRADPTALVVLKSAFSENSAITLEQLMVKMQNTQDEPASGRSETK